jgi:hypothetical protein
MLTVATHNSAGPYLAVTAGPDSHSPPPIAEAPMTNPGPSIANQFFQVNLGVSTNSPVVQRGMTFAPGCGASNFLVDEESDVAFASTVKDSPALFARLSS